MKAKYDEERFKYTIRKVLSFLIQKAVLEKRPQTENNQTILGGVSFWFKNSIDKSGNVLAPSELAFNAPPTVWDFDKIIVDLELLERNQFIHMGVDITGYEQN
jgi:hypothetical protein